MGGAGSANEAQPIAEPQAMADSQPARVENPMRAVRPEPSMQPPPVADSPREICDGSNAVRVYLNLSGPSGLVRPGMEFTFTSYAIITGECRFWVMLGTREEARTGALTREAGDQLADELHYAAWYRISDDEQGRGTIFDSGGGWVLADGIRKFDCNGFCTDPLAREMFERASRLPQELYDLGAPVEGPMRVSAVANSSFQGTPQKNTIDWPLSAPVERFAYDPYAEPALQRNSGVLLEDPADLKTLRALRPRLRGSDYGYIPVRADLAEADGGSVASTYDLYFRDVIPFEDRATGELRPF
jgi:hypothetical protein